LSSSLSSSLSSGGVIDVAFARREVLERSSAALSPASRRQMEMQIRLSQMEEALRQEKLRAARAESERGQYESESRALPGRGIQGPSPSCRAL